MSMMSNSNKISRREFNSKLGKIGAGLIAASVLPSFGTLAQNNPHEGKFIDVHHHLGSDLMTDSANFTFDPIIKWMNKNSVSQTVLLSPIQYPETYYPTRAGNIIRNDELLEKFQETNGRLLPFCLV